ncbi:MAG: hypothetical protein ACOX7R_07975 [Acetivibrionales bacterium]|jgi:hypothetical protein
MTDKKGVLSDVFDDCSILWFIILFLILFWRCICREDGYFFRDEQSRPDLTIE